MSNDKYIFTDETIKENGRTLKRIKALRDFGDVKAGDLGGYIESEANLATNGNSWVYDVAKVMDKATVTDDGKVKAEALVSEKASVLQDGVVSGKAIVRGSAEIAGNAVISGNAQVSGDTWAISGFTSEGVFKTGTIDKPDAPPPAITSKSTPNHDRIGEGGVGTI